MDAKVDDWVVTPRRGKAVEINALWYDALRLLEGWVREEGDAETARDLAAHADRVRESFKRRFWYPEGGHLYDVVDGETGDDPALRPNRLAAISLRHPVLDPTRWASVLDLGSIGEIYDAEPPLTPRGFIAQAWSVAEVLRCWVKTAEPTSRAAPGQPWRPASVAMPTEARRSQPLRRTAAPFQTRPQYDDASCTLAAIGSASSPAQAALRAVEQPLSRSTAMRFVSRARSCRDGRRRSTCACTSRR